MVAGLRPFGSTLCRAAGEPDMGIAVMNWLAVLSGAFNGVAVFALATTIATQPPIGVRDLAKRDVVQLRLAVASPVSEDAAGSPAKAVATGDATQPKLIAEPVLVTRRQSISNRTALRASPAGSEPPPKTTVTTDAPIPYPRIALLAPDSMSAAEAAPAGFAALSVMAGEAQQDAEKPRIVMEDASTALCASERSLRGRPLPLRTGPSHRTEIRKLIAPGDCELFTTGRTRQLGDAGGQAVWLEVSYRGERLWTNAYYTQRGR